MSVRLPVVDVHKENIRDVWPAMLLSLRSANFIAIDLELSGLGDRRKLNCKLVDERYAALRAAASSRAIVSVGLSCFKLQAAAAVPAQLQASKEGDRVQQQRAPLTNYLVQTYNVLTLCTEEYTVEPGALQFLVNHGFDFNKQYSHGLPYTRGNVKTDYSSMSLRTIVGHLSVAGIPIVFHNGLVDLVFIYQNLYSDLPDKLETFLADLSDLFSGGVYDTKYIAEFHERMQASFLEYVFRKCYRANEQRPSVAIVFPDYLFYGGNVIYKALQSEPAPDSKSMLSACKPFSAHGWCSAGFNCSKSHSVDFILDCQEAKSRKGKRRCNSSPADDDRGAVDKCSRVCASEGTPPKLPVPADRSECQRDVEGDGERTSPTGVRARACELASEDLDTKSNAARPNQLSGCHRAGYDAFMTGFSFASFSAKYDRQSFRNGKVGDSNGGMAAFANKLCLSGKDIPLQIVRGNFAKLSQSHIEKKEAIKTVLG